MSNWEEWGAWANAVIETGSVRWNAVESDYIPGWGGYGAGFGVIQFTSSAIETLNYIVNHGGDINKIPNGNLKNAILSNNGAGYNGVSSGALNAPGPYTPAETDGLKAMLDEEGARKAQSDMIRSFYNNDKGSSMNALRQTFPTNDLAKCIGMRLITNVGNALTYVQGNNDNTPTSELIAQADSFSQYVHAQAFADLLNQQAGDYTGHPPVNVWNYGGGGDPSPNPPTPGKPGGNNVPSKPKPKPVPKPTYLQLKPGILRRDTLGAIKFQGQDLPNLVKRGEFYKIDFETAKPTPKPPNGGGANSNNNQSSGKNPNKPKPTPPPSGGGTPLKQQLDDFYNKYKGQYIQNGQCVGLSTAWTVTITNGEIGMTPWNSQTANPDGSPTSANVHFDYRTNVGDGNSAGTIGAYTPPGWDNFPSNGDPNQLLAGDIFWCPVIVGALPFGHTGVVFADHTAQTIEQNYSYAPVTYYDGGAYTSWGLYPWNHVWRMK